MNLEQLRKTEWIMFECVAGSHSYGTNNEDSDVDLRGIFRVPNEFWLSIVPVVQQVSDETNDVTFYELRRYFELASGCNPNIIELLWTPEDCVVHVDPVMQHLLDNRELFISQKAYHTFSGYAFAQIKRAKGQNKWVNNPQPETPPDRLDFCWIIPVFNHRNGPEALLGQFETPDLQPFRPFPLKKCYGVAKEYGNLSEYHAAGLEHVSNAYRLYFYGEKAKGVFRGEHQQLVVESIPMDDEWKKFRGILIYDDGAYQRAKKDWKNYWTWRKERNEARYRSQEAGEIDYDAKNMMHCMRLLWSGKNILTYGEPIVRFEGEKLQILRDIRTGKFSHAQLMEWTEQEMAELDKLKEASEIPHSVNQKAIDKLYQELIHMKR